LRVEPETQSSKVYRLCRAGLLNDTIPLSTNLNSSTPHPYTSISVLKPKHPTTISPTPTNKTCPSFNLVARGAGWANGGVLRGGGGGGGLGTISVRTTPQPSVPIPRTRTLARLIISRFNPVATRHLIRLLFKSLASAILLFGSIMVDKLCRLATLLPEKSFSQRACNLTPLTPPTEVAGVGGGGLRRRIWEGELRR
jgi:hypothetical protein